VNVLLRRAAVLAGAAGAAVLASVTGGGCGGNELGQTGSSSSSSASTSSGGGGAGGAVTTATGSGGAGGGMPSVNHPPVITSPGDLGVDEDQTLSVAVHATDPDGDPLRLYLTGLPPGARWDEAAGQLTFTPDFIQGGHAWTVTATADDGKARTAATFTITAHDTIHPPAPTVVKSEPLGGFTRLTLSQVTDTYLDSPGYAGRSFDAVVIVPDPVAGGHPVRVVFHGFDGVPWTDGWSGEFRINAHDPMDTYWWGYADSLPGKAPGPGAKVPDYTMRRVLHLLGWVLDNHPDADPERVYADGASMGGAGAAMMGLLHARHVSWVNATIFQAIPRNHRPSRLAQLTGLWGAPADDLPSGYGMGVWDWLDLTRVLEASAEARDQAMFLKHGKDDSTIHFGAVVLPSPLTQKTFYQALAASRPGYEAVWDEGAHGPADPVLGDGWWQVGWNPVFDATAFARRSLAFPAFSGSSVDGNPGTGAGNGKQPWNAETGYAGQLPVAGDTGWDGDVAGALNRFLRWDATQIVDTLDAFAVPVTVLDGQGGAPPKPGYPTTGDRLDGTAPVHVDVTVRRAQAFRCKPGETVGWTFGAASGKVVAGASGDVTVPGLAVTTGWTTLALVRSP
jgi:hypothetical protein